MLLQRVSSCFALLLVVTLSSAEAQWYDHHPPYQDPVFNLDGSRRTAVYEAHYSATCGSCGTGQCGCGVSDASFDGNEGVAGANGSSSRLQPRTCPQTTTARLQVWVDDSAEVMVNKQKTRRQVLGGVHAGSRVYTLTGLKVDEGSLTEVTASLPGKTPVTKTAWVQAGDKKAIRFTAQELVAFQEPAEEDMLDPVTYAIDLAEKAQRAAEAAREDAARAQRAADAAKDKAQKAIDAKDALEKRVKAAEAKITNYDKQIAALKAKLSLALRTNDETIKINTAALDAGATYEPGKTEAKSFVFDTGTSTTIELEATKGDGLMLSDGVAVPVTLKFSVALAAGGTKEVLTEKTMLVFNQAKAEISTKGLASAIKPNWSRALGDGTLTVTIEGKLPNGKPIPITGTPITITVKDISK